MKEYELKKDLAQCAKLSEGVGDLVLMLEIARGLAALWVFLFHIRDLVTESVPWLSWLVDHGALGVPMFFVISGYVITHSAVSSLKKSTSPVIFLKNRFRRIYPTFWISVLIILVLPYVIEAVSFFKTSNYVWPQDRFSEMGAADWFYLLSLINVFFATSSDLQSQFSSINAVYWTIAIEFQFYLVVFICLMFKAHFWRVITLISILSFANLVIPFGLNYGLFLYYWPAFAIGILLAYLHMQDYRFILKPADLAKVGIVGVIGVSLELTKFVNSYHLGFAILFGVLLWSLAGLEKNLANINQKKSLVVRLFFKPWLVLGAMSYSVYLIHGKVYQLPEMFVRQIVDLHNPLYSILTIFGTLLLCYLMYVFVEKRFLSSNYKKIHALATK